MIGLIQRVSTASVCVAGEEVGGIGPGILLLLGVERGDGPATAERLLERVLGYRIFPDPAGRMNLSLTDVAGGLLVVPQFTLAADTAKGTRPSFTPAASPELGAALFEAFLTAARRRHDAVAAGRFGAHMLVRLENDGPVTFWLRVNPGR